MANHPHRKKPSSPAARDLRPTAAAVRRAREAAGLTQTEAGALVHSGLKSWQNWEAEGGESRQMHPSTWELFNIKIKAGELLAKGRITPALLEALGIEIPPRA